MNLPAFYHTHIEKLTAKISILKHRNRLFVIGEIVFFLALVGFVILYTLIENGGWTLYVSAICLLAYLVVRRFDVKNDEKTDALDRLRQTYQAEFDYLTGLFEDFGDGSIYADSHHPFAHDLDIFGPKSLFQRINRTVSRGGSDRLARRLTLLPADETRPQELVALRRQAIDELSQKETWRMAFLAEGRRVTGGIDTRRILAALAEAKTISIPQFAAHRLPAALVCASIAGFFVSLALSIFTSFSAQIPIWWGTIHFFGALLVCAKSLRMVNQCVGVLHPELKAYIHILRLLADEDFKATLTLQATETLKGALESFNRLEKILDTLDRRGNILGLMLSNTLFLSDFFLVRNFLKWQQSYMEKIAQWVDAVSEIDANVSMATFRFNHPEAVEAEIVGTDGIFYHAEELYHPFLGPQAVRNDFSLGHAEYQIITGANMAGKSTFLRSVGVNYVLAMAGLSVFARRMRVSCFQLFSSMRTSDDLTHGISYFNAELLRLEQLLSFCRRHRYTLIILDEILKGTNSLDKLNGSRLFLETIAKQPVSGLIATHDLELSKLEDAPGSPFTNYCFEIELGDDVTYSYKIRRGVAQNQNATFLLKQILQDNA